ncbi:MAG: GatB/YqeY domain-containing protein [Thiobacillaceae bacterium]
MSLKITILEDVKTAMKAKETVRLATLRMLTAAMKQREVDERIELDDAAVLAIVEKLIKQRKDSIDQFGKAGRKDLVDAETAELAVLTAYLPAQLSEAELMAAIDAAIAAAGAVGPKDMGKLMGTLKPQLAGKADMGKVSALLRKKLGG